MLGRFIDINQRKIRRARPVRRPPAVTIETMGEVHDLQELYDDPAKQPLSGSGQAYDPANFVRNEEGYVVAKASWRCGEDLINRIVG